MLAPKCSADPEGELGAGGDRELRYFSGGSDATARSADGRLGGAAAVGRVQRRVGCVTAGLRVRVAVRARGRGGEGGSLGPGQTPGLALAGRRLLGGEVPALLRAPRSRRLPRGPAVPRRGIEGVVPESRARPGGHL